MDSVFLTEKAGAGKKHKHISGNSSGKTDKLVRVLPPFLPAVLIILRMSNNGYFAVLLNKHMPNNTIFLNLSSPGYS